MVERLRMQMPRTIDLRTGNYPEAVGVLLHQHAVIQNACCMHNAAKMGCHCEYAGNVIGIADVGRNHFDLDAGVFQCVQYRALVIGGNTTASGEQQVAGARRCKELGDLQSQGTHAAGDEI